MCSLSGGCFRLVEEVRERCQEVTLHNDDVYLATTLDEFVRVVILRLRGEGDEDLKFDAVSFTLCLLVHMYIVFVGPYVHCVC